MRCASWQGADIPSHAGRHRSSWKDYALKLSERKVPLLSDAKARHSVVGGYCLSSASTVASSDMHDGHEALRSCTEVASAADVELCSVGSTHAGEPGSQDTELRTCDAELDLCKWRCYELLSGLHTSESQCLQAPLLSRERSAYWSRYSTVSTSSDAHSLASSPFSAATTSASAPPFGHVPAASRSSCKGGVDAELRTPGSLADDFSGLLVDNLSEPFLAQSTGCVPFLGRRHLESLRKRHSKWEGPSFRQRGSRPATFVGSWSSEGFESAVSFPFWFKQMGVHLFLYLRILGIRARQKFVERGFHCQTDDRRKFIKVVPSEVGVRFKSRSQLLLCLGKLLFALVVFSGLVVLAQHLADCGPLTGTRRQHSALVFEAVTQQQSPAAEMLSVASPLGMLQRETVVASSLKKEEALSWSRYLEAGGAEHAVVSKGVEEVEKTRGRRKDDQEGTTAITGLVSFIKKTESCGKIGLDLRQPFARDSYQTTAGPLPALPSPQIPVSLLRKLGTYGAVTSIRFQDRPVWKLIGGESWLWFCPRHSCWVVSESAPSLNSCEASLVSRPARGSRTPFDIPEGDWMLWDGRQWRSNALSVIALQCQQEGDGAPRPPTPKRSPIEKRNGTEDEV